MLTIETTASALLIDDRLNIAGSWFTITRRIHGAWYLDVHRSRYIEFEIRPDSPDAGSFVPSVLRVPKATSVLVVRRSLEPPRAVPLAWSTLGQGHEEGSHVAA